ncbi:MAG TPA: hypothetical protein VH440_01590 [Candidatus Limnocylindrales bacterium]
MNGYAATARIRGATPRLVGSGRDPWSVSGAPNALVEEMPELQPGPGEALPSPQPTLAERWESARERWSQLTFYVFSSEFWH